MIDITIPVLNEEKILKKNVLFLHYYLANEIPNIGDWQIIIADNGSSDETKAISIGLTHEYSEIKYLNVNKKGVGRALKASWTASKANYIGYMDLDLATDLKHMKQILPAFANNYDIVYGSRLLVDSKVSGRSLKREITSRCFNFVVRKYLKVKLTDGMCGFKFLRKEVFDKLYNSGANSDGWFFSTELIVTGEWNHYNLLELPIEWRDSDESHVKIVPLALEYIKAMRRLKSFKPISISS